MLSEARENKRPVEHDGEVHRLTKRYQLVVRSVRQGGHDEVVFTEVNERYWFPVWSRNRELHRAAAPPRLPFVLRLLIEELVEENLEGLLLVVVGVLDH